MPYNFVADSFHTGVTAEALRAKIDRKSTISLQRGHFDPKFQVQGVAPPPPIIFSRLVRPMSALQLWRPPLGDLGAMYDDHLIGSLESA